MATFIINIAVLIAVAAAVIAVIVRRRRHPALQEIAPGIESSVGATLDLLPRAKARAAIEANSDIAHRPSRGPLAVWRAGSAAGQRFADRYIDER